ncbi:hypothetical protein ACQPYA_06190 [Micromonospora sp. CA-263727]|uniref:hypothetical protein n=1 Tax=Micromonospora sp. CA-263727 TaxID=3239967 RepID=UPI003D8D1397
MTGLARRSMMPTALLLVVLSALVAVMLSPLGLLWIGERPGYDWPLVGTASDRSAARASGRAAG